MLYKLGRFLQLLGLLITPIGIGGNLAEQIDVRTSLEIAAVGIGVFMIGWLVQHASGGRT
jgi:hypothetical protein